MLLGTPESGIVSIVTRTPVTNMSTMVLPINTKRIRATIFNDGGNAVYIKEGKNASLTSFTYRLGINEGISIKDYLVEITAIRASGNGAIIITEILP